MSNHTEELSSAGHRLAGKYLTFRLQQESYGVGVLRIREIIRLHEITTVPNMPAHIKGVLNLRGKIIPVIDLRARFGLEPAAANERSCIVVVQVTSAAGLPRHIGLIVDAVEEVLNITAAEIEATPDFGGRQATESILGMAKVKGGVKTLLDIDQVVTGVKAVSVSEREFEEGGGDRRRDLAKAMAPAGHS